MTHCWVLWLLLAQLCQPLHQHWAHILLQVIPGEDATVNGLCDAGREHKSDFPLRCVVVFAPMESIFGLIVAISCPQGAGVLFTCTTGVWVTNQVSPFLDCITLRQYHDNDVIPRKSMVSQKEGKQQVPFWLLTVQINFSDFK